MNQRLRDIGSEKHHEIFGELVIRRAERKRLSAHHETGDILSGDGDRTMNQVDARHYNVVFFEYNCGCRPSGSLSEGQRFNTRHTPTAFTRQW